MRDAITVVEDEVRELVRRRHLDPTAEPAAVRRLVDEVIADYDERSLRGTLPALPDVALAARLVFDSVAGFGPLQRFLDDPSVEEIWINEPSKVFVARRGVSELTTTILTAARSATWSRRCSRRPGAGSTCRRRSSTRCCPTAPPARRHPGHHRDGTGRSTSASSCCRPTPSTSWSASGR
jgi:hypothetical protein